jgi:hypothetical protein
VNVPVQLETSDVAGLERVAEGRASAVPEHVTARLLAMGLVQQYDEAGRGPVLQLTPRGLSYIRSSDQ